MIRKLIIGVLMVYLLFILGQSFFKLFDMDTEVVDRYKQWAKVLTKKTIKTKLGHRSGGGYSTSWRMTVSVKNKTPTVILMVGPPPKLGECVPIIVNELSNGNLIASIDNEEWRYGTTYGSCD